MPGTMLTEDQARHLVASVHVLLADLAGLAQHSDLASGADALGGVRVALGRTQQAALRLLRRLADSALRLSEC